MNQNIPPMKVLVRNEFLFNQSTGFGEFTEAWIHGVRSVKGHALQFYALLNTGALFTGLPLHSFCTDESAPQWNLGTHQLWDNLSYDIDVIELSFLKKMTCTILLKNKKREPGNYLFTIDYLHSNPNTINSTLTHTPDEWKGAHVIELDNGNIVAYPPNRILFKDAALTLPDVDPSKLGYKVNTHIWDCEDGNKYSLGDQEEFFYREDKE